MPLATAIGTKKITVLTVDVIMWVTPFDVKVGEIVSFAGRVMINGEGAPDRTRVDIYLVANGNLLPITSAYTESHDPWGSGFFGWNPPYSETPIDWMVPDTFNGYKIPCATWDLAAISLGQRDAGGAAIRVAYPVRIRNFTAPESIPTNVAFTISGYLEFQDAGVWKGLDGQSIDLSYNGNLFGSVTTGVDGYFEKTDCVIPLTGTYTLRAEFAGVPTLHLPPATATTQAVIGPIPIEISVPFIALPIAIGTILTLISRK